MTSSRTITTKIDLEKCGLNIDYEKRQSGIPLVNKLMLVSEYRRKRFAGQKKPSEKTIKRWIIEGTIPGKKLGGRYYVDVTEEAKQVTGDPEVDRRLRKLAEEFGFNLIDE